MRRRRVRDGPRETSYERLTGREFVCAAALALPDGRSCTVSAAMESEIGYEIA